jgi:LacI family transcriptional regulator
MERYCRKILVIFSKTDVTHRQMLKGILEFARGKCLPPWEVQLDQRNIYRRSAGELKNGGFSGIIAAVGNSSDRRRYLDTGLPTVLFEPTLAGLHHYRRRERNVTVFNDHAAEGRAAAEYYLKRGYKSFAYVGTAKTTVWSRERQRGFAARLEKDGMSAAVYPEPEQRDAADFIAEAPKLSRWLKRLPKATALFAAHDERALQVLSAAARAGISIPQQLAILGVDDDELICTTASPPLSSIPVNAEETGWRIAKTMHDLLENRNPEPVIRTCHTRVTTRQSTDAFALTDPFVARALAFALKNLDKPIGVKEMADAANCSRRTLQMKMLSALHLTPQEELSRLRREHAAKLLKETALPIAEVARLTGYCSPSHMNTQLKRHLGLGSSAVRKS